MIKALSHLLNLLKLERTLKGPISSYLALIDLLTARKAPFFLKIVLGLFICPLEKDKVRHLILLAQHD
jgi:hypothetical protein